MAILGLKGGVLSAFNLFVDAIKVDGVESVTLPDLKPMTTTLKGTGIAGEVEVPISGKFPSTQIKFKMSNPTNAVNLTRAGFITLTIKGNFKKIESMTGLNVDVPYAITTKVMFKGRTGGNIEVGANVEQEYEYEVIAWTELHEGVPVLIVDKLNNIYQELGTVGNTVELINIGGI